MWLAGGALPWRDGVTVTDDGRFVATFGLLKVDTPVANIAETHAAGPYRWWTAVGPRISFADDGLTFGTNPRAGLCIHFHTRSSVSSACATTRRSPSPSPTPVGCKPRCTAGNSPTPVLLTVWYRTATGRHGHERDHPERRPDHRVGHRRESRTG